MLVDLPKQLEKEYRKAIGGREEEFGGRVEEFAPNSNIHNGITVE